MHKIRIHFICNFKPNIKTNKKKIKKKIFCKNFILFLMFLNYSKKMNSSVFIKPLKKERFICLKAPHRFKLSKHTFVFLRYNIIFSLNFKDRDTFHFQNFNILVIFLKSLKKIFFRIDSSICTQNCTFLSINFCSTYDFKIINFI